MSGIPNYRLRDVFSIALALMMIAVVFTAAGVIWLLLVAVARVTGKHWY